jgi:hypothetical protein
MTHNKEKLIKGRSWEKRRKAGYIGNSYPLLLRSMASFAAMSLFFMSAIAANTPMYAEAEESSTNDNFDGSTYNLSDGETSPNNKWIQSWTGKGEAGTMTIHSTGNEVFFAKPKAPTSPDETHSSLTLSTNKWQDIEINLKVRTKEQLRQNSDPNAWEAAWVMWRYVDSYHHYYFVVKENGIELGKKDNNRQAEEQVFLHTAKSPKLELGEWSNWKIKMEGEHIQVYLNGDKVADYTDDDMSDTLSKPGAVGLYTEDAYVQFDNVHISSPS